MEQRTRELISGLYDAVVNMDEDAAKQLSQAAVAEGVNAYAAVDKGLSAAMAKVGDLYANGEYFVPELLLCSDALYTALDILKPHIKVEEARVKRQIILGTVEGDIHDIGKNLVKIMFEAAGWIVHDLGRDVKLQRFAEEQRRTNSDVVGLSGLTTTSMLAIPKAIEIVKSANPNVAVMAGGAPLTREIAERYGADGYAENAGEAVQEAIEMLDRMGKS